MNCRQREGTSAALHGIERARQIPKTKMSSSYDVVQVNEIGIEIAINNMGRLRNRYDLYCQQPLIKPRNLIGKISFQRQA